MDLPFHAATAGILFLTALLAVRQSEERTVAPVALPRRGIRRRGRRRV